MLSNGSGVRDVGRNGGGRVFSIEFNLKCPFRTVI